MSLRIAYLAKRSALTAFMSEGSARMEKLLARRDPTVARMRSTHETHGRAVEQVLAAIEALGAKAVEIGPKTRDLASDSYALVISIGGDGTLLRASHFVRDVPVLGVNSAPSSSVGFFCSARADGEDFLPTLERALDGRIRATVLSRMEVEVEGRVVSSRVLNDALYCHTSPAATSRYLLDAGGVVEEQKSSGFWVGPAAGSTAAQRSAGGRVLPLTSPKLQLVVREPYTPLGERYELLRVLCEPGDEIVVRSKMREAAMFLDGPDVKVDVGFGDVVRFRRGAEPLSVLGIGTRRSGGSTSTRSAPTKKAAR